ncbi:MAG: DUF4870 domain-containing protein [Candidatus Korobacteraceae bacterium]
MNDFPTPPPDSSSSEPAASGSVPSAPAQPGVAGPAPAETSLPPVTRDECTLGMLAHVLQIFSWLLGPGIIFLVRRDSKFVRYHALQALFFQFLVIIVWAASLLTLFAGVFVGIARRGESGFAAAFALPILILIVLWGGGALTWILNLVLGIVYGLRANNGEWAGYPGIKYLAAKVAGVDLEAH